MKILAYTPEGFKLNSKHVDKIKSVADVELEIAGSEKELNSLLPSAELFICSNYNFKQEWVEKAAKLKWIHSTAAGVEKILPAIRSSDILLTNAKGVHCIQITEQVLGYMIMHERKLDYCLKAQLDKKWVLSEFKSPNPVPGELYGKTVLIAGLGNIGRRMAEVFSCIGMKVIAVKSDVSVKAEFVEKVYSTVELKIALGLADYVVVALPHTKETHHLFSSNEFSSMKRTAFFINIGRGSIVDEPSLIRALKEKVIAGAALDVFEQEPLPGDSELWGMDNVIITPHHAGLTPHYMDRLVDIFCENLKAFLQGKKLPTLVDREKEY